MSEHDECLCPDWPRCGCPEKPIRVRVFRESPAWDKAEKPFMLPDATYLDLYVISYDVWDGSGLDEKSPAVREIRARHPDCVLVY